MPRRARIAPDGFIHHVVNRGDHRETIFHKSSDFRAFLCLMREATCHVDMRLLAYCVMNNHFHLVLWPRKGEDLSAYMQWLMTAHIQRYRRHYPPSSPGHIYQGRYTNSLIQSDRHLLTVMRYVEANPLAARLVERAEHYDWSSLSPTAMSSDRPHLVEGPISRPADWLEFVNTPPAAAESKRIRESARRGAPFGSDAWVAAVAAEHGLEHTLRSRGRPRICESMDPGRRAERQVI